MAPRHALAAADSDAGKTGSDAAALIALKFAAGHLREIVIAVWLAVAVGVGAGATALAVALSAAVTTDLMVLFGGAALLFAAAGRRRSLGRDFDLACVAFVPYLAVDLVASLVYLVAGRTPGRAESLALSAVAIGWAALVLVLAWQQARSREVPS